MIALSGGVVRLLAIARRLTSLLMWLGVIGLLAGAYSFSELATSDDPAAAVLLAALFFGPPLVVLHFVLLIRLVRLRLGLLVGSQSLRQLLAARLLSLGAFIHPWYWLLLFSSVLACLASVPIAVAVAVL